MLAVFGHVTAAQHPLLNFYGPHVQFKRRHKIISGASGIFCQRGCVSTRVPLILYVRKPEFLKKHLG